MNKHLTIKRYIIVVFVAGSLFSNCKNKSEVLVKHIANDSTLKQGLPDSTGSIFMLTDSFKTQRNKNFRLSFLSSKPTVMAMIFTNCSYACPKITSDMKDIAERLHTKRDKVNFLLVSFDSERDNPAQLHKFADKMGLDSNWILLHGSDEAARTLSVMLNVQFEKDAEGNFSHSNVISVLDKNGLLKYQRVGLDNDSSEIITKIERLIN